ncbi:Mrp/NBP35 family ATP-binding protein [Paenibacillus sp. GSMTC-2017]|uniref:Mrp/NBP35 family ATP-binding protein n=1 Tax=Paenibacillus sp. GSMTC-2017 TaxID=2794350 RepID=UPI0018D5CD37|nr:Mrp/NBP35 family ATP-binding protein [Paenibacillus sp. GSMTC-2017]MBH5320759.1 Mrp/NBP35 family ATP-binding protein [Paenibacillus sp. GSMTC-2017]
MLTREQALEAIEALMAKKYSAEGISFRDVMVRNRQVSLTVLGASAAAQPALEASLREALAPLGAETVHCRFRDEGAQAVAGGAAQAPAAKAAPAGSSAGEGAASPVQGHGADLASPLLSASSGTTFIAVASGKGGVGKSTVTVNLAVALARRGKRVGIIDADIYGFSVPDMMGIEERPEVVNDRVIPIERYGVKVISMGFFVEDNSPIVWRGPMLGKMLRNFFQEIEWGELDYMLLDLPPGTGDIALDVHQIIPQSKEIIVTTPHATAAFVAARAGAMAIKTDHEIIGVVENMSYFESKLTGEKEYVFGRGGGARLAETLHSDLLAQIPLGAPDNHPSEADFSPSVYKAESETGKLYLELADNVLRRV